MPYVNNCSFAGHVGRPAELKSSLDGTKNYAEFSLAIGTGTVETPETMWVKCRVYGKNYMRVIEKVNKGDTVYVTGKLKAKAYNRKADGQAQTDLTLFVNDWSWLKGKAAPDATDVAYAAPVETVDGEIPF